MRVIQKNMLYVPANLVSEEHLAQYESEVFDQPTCARCPVLVEDDEQGSYRCDGCPANKGSVKLHQFIKRGSKEFVGFPSGNLRKFKRLFPKAQVRDKRCTTPIPHKLEFTGTLLPHQKKCVKQFLSRGRGILEAPPRSGKTVMMVYLICNYGYKALILAHQDDLLTQFLTTLHKFTNIQDVEKFHGVQLAGIAKKPEELDKYAVSLCTYQSFIREGSGEAKLRKHLYGKFGFVAIDECHRVAADCFSKVVNGMDSKVRFGVTGTVDRKDGMEFITTDILGPVTARAEVDSMKPTVRITATSFNFDSRETWVGFINTLSKHEKRNQLLVDIAITAIKAGHSVIIPVARKQHIVDLVTAINANFDEPIAAEFHASVDKEQVLNDARSGKIKCVVAIRQMVQEGIDVPCWSYMVECVPISNPPKFYQESMRICTPMKGKEVAFIHFVVDTPAPQSVGCFRTILFKSIFPLKFNMSDSIKDECLSIAKGKTRTHVSAPNSSVTTKSSSTNKKLPFNPKQGVFRQF